jgi:hypothetical protein
MILQNYISLYEKDATERYYQRIGKKVPAKLQDKSALEKLMKYKSNSKVFFSFRDIYRIGINPNSKWTTPNGIYTYPLKTVSTIKKDRYDFSSDKIIVPFAGDKPIIYVIESVGRGIKDLNLYTESNLTDDFEKLKKAMTMKVNQRYVKEFLITLGSSIIMKQIAMEASIIPSAIQNCKTITEYIDILYSFSSIGARVNTFGGRLWYITYYLAKGILGSRFSNIWNSIFRKLLKYNFVVDLGQSIIHPNEPYQAVFFNTKSFKVLDVIENKYPTEAVDENEYIRQDNIVWDYEFSKMTYSEALKRIESKRGNWRLPTMEELYKARIESVKGFVKTRKMKNDYNYYFSNKVKRIDNFEDYVYIYDLIDDVESRIPVTSNEKHYVRLVRDVKVRQIKKPINDPKISKAWISDKTKKSSEMSNVQLIYKTVQGSNIQGVADLNKELIKKITEAYPNYRLPSLNNFRIAYEHIENTNSDLKDIFGNDSYWCVISRYINVEDIKPIEVYIFNFLNGDYNTALLGDVANIALIKK